MPPGPGTRYWAWSSSPTAPTSPPAALFASIEDLYVRPEARRKGVGKALLEAADERCAAREISYVEVQVEDEAAEAFYAALGYEPETGVRVLSRSLAIAIKQKELKARVTALQS